ncbi:MAG: BatA domain-containing protein [Verrucomicrobiales bacterium]|nr:BatA domain-containing protein [Verrucomicrobiales bacterium]
MFAASIFLVGLFAVGAPIAIHLLARQRTRVLPWGAMDFLKESITSASSRRNRLRDLILLLLRALAILFLILTFAQPLASRLLFGGGKLETVFVWDVSMSTNTLDTNGVPLQEAMKESLLDELEQLPDRSQVRILVVGADLRWLKDSSLTLSRNNRKALRKAIEEQSTDSGESELASAILVALSREGEEEPSLRDIVLVQDFHQVAWQEEESNRWEIIRQKLVEDPDLSLRVLELETEVADDRPQVAVANLEADRDAVGVGIPVRLRATLINQSWETVTGAEVVWLVDGQEVERSIGMELQPEAEVKLEEVIRLESEGCHRVECFIELDDDLLSEDNRAVTVIAAHESLPVLIVDDTQRTERGQVLPSEFLVASLGRKPEKNAKDKKKPSESSGSLFRSKVTTSRELNDAMLADQLAVLIAKADSLSADSLASLEDFVKRGGGLWIMMDVGSDALPQWNAELLNQLGLLPLSRTNLKTAENPEKPFQLKPSQPGGAFARNMAARNLDLFRAEISSLHELDDPVFLNEEVLLETRDGRPFLLSLPVGSGRLLLQTANLTRENSNFPVLQSFVPFVREATRECLIRALPKRNLEPGEPIRFPDTSEVNEPILTLPDGTTEGMVFQGNAYEMTATLRPGIYFTGEEEAPNEIFSVIRPASESELQWLSPEEANAMIETGNDVSPAGASEERREGKWPLALWFAILTALFFLAEAILAYRISRQREVRGNPLDLKPVF